MTETDPMGNVISYEYDALGQASSITNAMGDKLTFTYTPTGRIASVTNPEGGVTNYTYDACGNLIQTIDALGNTINYEYDALGNVIQEHRGEVQTHQYTYDATNHMTLGKNLENGTQTEYTYNALYMRIRNLQTLAGEDGFYTRDVKLSSGFPRQGRERTDDL